MVCRVRCGHVPDAGDSPRFVVLAKRRGDRSPDNLITYLERISTSDAFLDLVNILEPTHFPRYFLRFQFAARTTVQADESRAPSVFSAALRSNNETFGVICIRGIRAVFGGVIRDSDDEHVMILLRPEIPHFLPTRRRKRRNR